MSEQTNINEIMKYRRKPEEVEAFRMKKVGPSSLDWPEWAQAAWCDGVMFADGETNRLTIKTLEGNHAVNDGDWIIRGVRGELYPCKPDIFEAAYEAA